MRSKILILVAAVVLGLLSAFFAARYLDSARSEIAAQAEPITVLVATRDVPTGTSAADIVSQGFVEERKVPRQYVAGGAISSPASIEGRVLAVPLTRGEQLTSARFKVAEQVGLSYAVPEGYVAISVPNSAARGVSGFISPGDHVMVIASFDSGDLKGAVTKTLISNAPVLAAGSETSQTVTETGQNQTGGGGLLNARSSGTSDAGPLTITLAVTPVDAERLIFAQEAGTVWYALLASTSTTVPSTAGEHFPQVLR